MACLFDYFNHITWAVTLNILLRGMTPVMSGGTGYQQSYPYPGTRGTLTPYSHLGAVGQPYGYPGYPGYVGGVQYQPAGYGIPQATGIGSYSPKTKPVSPLFSGSGQAHDPRLYPGQIGGYGSPYVGSPYGPAYQPGKPKPPQHQIPLSGGFQPQVPVGGAGSPVDTNGLYYPQFKPKLQQIPTGGIQPQVPSDQIGSQGRPLGTVTGTPTGAGTRAQTIPSHISGEKQKPYQQQPWFGGYPQHGYVSPQYFSPDAARSYGIPSTGGIPVVSTISPYDNVRAYPKVKSVQSGGWPSDGFQQTGGGVVSPSGLVPPTSPPVLAVTTGLPGGHQTTDQKPPKPSTPVDGGMIATIGGDKQKPYVVVPTGFPGGYDGYGLQGVYPPSFTGTGTAIGQFQKPKVSAGYGTWPGTGTYGVPPQYYQQPTYGAQPYGTRYVYPGYLAYGQQQQYPLYSATGSLQYKPK